MADGIENAAVVCCFMTPDYEKSLECKYELQYAQKRRKTIIPCLLTDKKVWNPSTWLRQITACLEAIDFCNTSDSDTDSTTSELIYRIRERPTTSQYPLKEIAGKSCYLFELIRYEYEQNSRIELFMDPSKSFPIEQSYINLAIVEAEGQHAKESQLGDAQHAIDVLGTFEQIYGTKTAIDVKNIFETCKDHRKQVLVFGRAGIGKSTFCRYIAYQWATGSYWPQYELLALIPLRCLTVDRYPPGKSYSLLDLVKNEVFSFDLTEKEQEILKEQFDAKKTLWILDGYDEVVQNVPPHLERLFKQLRETPHHILTSRPYLNTLSYHVKMEITGFTDENITEYVKQFFEQMRDELDDAMVNSPRLLKFLRSNQSIWGVAHIPVNLELICSLWSNEDWSETEQVTITKLYTKMTEWLCRRYLRTHDHQILQLSENEIDRHCQKELAFLESLAFNAMKSNKIIIPSSLLEDVLDEAKVSSQEYLHILKMGLLKSVNKQGINNRSERKKDHYFIHLSFQEYFAARYLINALKGSHTEKAIEFIKYQKYNQRYTLVFTFAAGLVSESDAKSYSNVFWENILGEPQDLVGIRHMQLIIFCMEETTDKSTLSRHAELFEWIAKCIQCSLTTKDGTIRRHLSQSLQRAPSVVSDQTITKVFINLLGDSETAIKTTVLSFISHLKILNPPIPLITSVMNRLDDRDPSVRMNACQAVVKMGEKAATTEVIIKLVSVLEDKNDGVRRTACEALGNMGEKAATPAVITKLVSVLGDERLYVREGAWEALGKMGEKAATNEVINKLMSALEDKNDYVRKGACEALGNMGEKAATPEVITKLVSTLGDKKDYVIKGASKALGKMGEKVAMNEVINKLMSALEDKNDYVRKVACEALGNMGRKAATPEVITKLVSALEDKNDYVRKGACEALGKMAEKAATPEVITKLVSALGDERNYVRETACEALAKIGEKAATPEVITKLVSVLEDKNDGVRRTACEALGNMGEKAATNEVITKLVSVLEDELLYIREGACEALGKMGEKAATPEVITTLVSALGDERDYVREGACEALGKMDEKAAKPEVITTLMSALKDQSHFVRKGACKALKEMGEKATAPEVINKLVNALEDKNDYVRKGAFEALVKMGKKAATKEVITKLVSALGDQSDDVRCNACVVLGRMGGKAATNEVISQLVALTNNKSSYLFEYAAKAVEGILRSFAVVKQLAPKIVAEVCLFRNALDCLENISEDELINAYLITKNPKLLPTLFQSILLRGAAVTVIENKIVVYGKTEPVELPTPTLVVRPQLIAAFTDKRERLHLSCSIPLEAALKEP